LIIATALGGTVAAIGVNIAECTAMKPTEPPLPPHRRVRNSGLPIIGICCRRHHRCCRREHRRVHGDEADRAAAATSSPRSQLRTPDHQDVAVGDTIAAVGVNIAECTAMKPTSRRRHLIAAFATQDSRSSGCCCRRHHRCRRREHRRVHGDEADRAAAATSSPRSQLWTPDHRDVAVGDTIAAVGVNIAECTAMKPTSHRRHRRHRCRRSRRRSLSRRSAAPHAPPEPPM